MGLDANETKTSLDGVKTIVHKKNVRKSRLAAQVNVVKEKAIVIQMKTAFQDLNVKKMVRGIFSQKEVTVQKNLDIGNVIDFLNGCKKLIGLEV